MFPQQILTLSLCDWENSADPYPPTFYMILLLWQFLNGKQLQGAAIFEIEFELIYTKYATEWAQVD
jgi:hypothetical protein